MKITYPNQSGILVQIDLSIENKTKFAKIVGDEAAKKSFAGHSDNPMPLIIFLASSS